MLSQIINIIQIILGVVLVVLILLQVRGTGLGSTFGSDFSFYGTKRGAEKILFILTIIIVTLFLVSSVAGVIF